MESAPPCSRGQVARIRQAGENVFARQFRIVGKDLVVRLVRHQKLQDELDGDSRPADYRLARQDRGVDDGGLR
jgi:hypothetical protein